MPDGKPRYVTGIDAHAGPVTIGTARDLEVTVLDANRAIWLATPEEVTSGPVQVQVRAHGRAIDCTVTVVGRGSTRTGRGGAFRLHLAEPLRGVAPGQAACSTGQGVRAGDYVLGSGTIVATGTGTS